MVAGGKDLYQNVAKLVEQNAKLLEKIDIKDKTRGWRCRWTTHSIYFASVSTR
jgi:hypothetical protein